MIIFRSNGIQLWSVLPALAPRAKVEQPFLVIQQQSGLQKSRLRGMAKSRWMVKVIAALTNLCLKRRLLLMAT